MNRLDARARPDSPWPAVIGATPEWTDLRPGKDGPDGEDTDVAVSEAPA